MPLTDRQIIADLGGHEALAEATGYRAATVKQWKLSKRGIPWKDRAKVAEIAKAKRVKLPADFLHAKHPAAPATQQGEAA